MFSLDFIFGFALGVGSFVVTAYFVWIPRLHKTVDEHNKKYDHKKGEDLKI